MRLEKGRAIKMKFYLGLFFLITILLFTVQLGNASKPFGVQHLVADPVSRGLNFGYKSWFYLLAGLGFLAGLILFVLFSKKNSQVKSLQKKREDLILLTEELEAKNLLLMADIQNARIPTSKKLDGIESGKKITFMVFLF